MVRLRLHDGREINPCDPKLCKIGKPAADPFQISPIFFLICHRACLPGQDIRPILLRLTIAEIERRREILRAFRAAFPHTLPIFAGFWFLGLTYGIYMNVSGFSFIYPMLMSITIFAGSIEFVTVNLLLGAFNPLQAFAMALMINARHLFYGISMLEKYRGYG